MTELDKSFILDLQINNKITQLSSGGQAGASTSDKLGTFVAAFVKKARNMSKRKLDGNGSSNKMDVDGNSSDDDVGLPWQGMIFRLTAIRTAQS